jgi:hypothetical protein
MDILWSSVELFIAVSYKHISCLMCRKHKNRILQLGCVLAITFWQWQRFIKNEILRKWIPCLCIIEASITHLLFYNFQPLHSKIPSFIGDKSVNLSWKELTKPSVPSTTVQAGYERCLILVFDSIFFFIKNFGKFEMILVN